jgi:hypothetical protein
VQDRFYKLGATAAMKLLGMVRQDGDDRHGTPFPEKSPTINAEALAKRLQEDDDSPSFVSPENAFHRDLGRPVTWGSSAHVDENQPNAGIMLPSNPRG